MGGGGILDVGCYAASFARKVAGAADNKPFLNQYLLKQMEKLDQRVLTICRCDTKV